MPFFCTHSPRGVLVRLIVLHPSPLSLQVLDLGPQVRTLNAGDIVAALQLCEARSQLIHLFFCSASFTAIKAWRAALRFFSSSQSPLLADVPLACVLVRRLGPTSTAIPPFYLYAVSSSAVMPISFLSMSWLVKLKENRPWSVIA